MIYLTVGGLLVVGTASLGGPIVAAHGHRLLSPAYTLGGLAKEGFRIQRRGQLLKTGLTALGLITGTNIHHDIYSSGGGGPGESPTSTDSPPALHQQGQPVSVVVPAASISAHGGRRSGTKARSRKRCPPGYRWNGKRCVRKG